MNIPFICQNYGKCCRIIGFPIGCAHLREIGDFLKITVDEVVEMLKGNTEDTWYFENLKPCIFFKESLLDISSKTRRMQILSPND
ncbi:MAG TPA: hypothetical protein EYP30_10130 [Archaeoglobaceae archaeon]|nr:hypothetical protein [Archaeoglobaceae archaeon]